MHGRNGSIHSASWSQSKSMRKHQRCFTKSILSIGVLCKYRWVVMHIQGMCVCDVAHGKELVPAIALWEMQYPDILRNAPSASNLEFPAAFCCSAESPGSLGHARTVTLALPWFSISWCRNQLCLSSKGKLREGSSLRGNLLRCSSWRIYVRKAFPLFFFTSRDRIESKTILNLLFLFPG